MLNFQEFLNIRESFDLDKKINYMYSPETSKALGKLYPKSKNTHAWMFTLRGNEYVVYTLTNNDFTEIHFADWTNNAEIKPLDIISTNASEVFGYVMRIIYEIKDKAYMHNIRIICPSSRSKLYTKLFAKVQEYFSEYAKTEVHKFKSIKGGNGEEIPTSAFELIKGKLTKGVDISEVKTVVERALMNKPITLEGVA